MYIKFIKHYERHKYVLTISESIKSIKFTTENRLYFSLLYIQRIM